MQVSSMCPQQLQTSKKHGENSDGGQLMNCHMCGCKTTVLETRTEMSALVMRRRRGCGQCEYKFFTHEIDDGLVETLKKYLGPHVKAIKKRQKLYARNEQILNMMRAGEKHFVIARAFKLSENMISTIARNAGIPAYQKTTREKNIK